MVRSRTPPGDGRSSPCAHPVARALTWRGRVVLRGVAALGRVRRRGGLVELNRDERAGRDRLAPARPLRVAGCATATAISLVCHVRSAHMINLHHSRRRNLSATFEARTCKSNVCNGRPRRPIEISLDTAPARRMIRAPDKLPCPSHAFFFRPFVRKVSVMRPHSAVTLPIAEQLSFPGSDDPAQPVEDLAQAVRALRGVFLHQR